MDRFIISVSVAIFMQTAAAFGGEQIIEKTEGVPSPAPPLSSFFRANELDLGVFGTYAKGSCNNPGSVGEHGWGGGADLSYFPLVFAGARIQGTILNTIPGDNTTGIVTADVILRYPLDLNVPNLHLAPYAFAGIGGVFTGSDDFCNLVRSSAEVPWSSSQDEFLGNIGGGLEYRFTPQGGAFSEVGYNFVDGSGKDFLQVNFGVKFSF